MIDDYLSIIASLKVGTKSKKVPTSYQEGTNKIPRRYQQDTKKVPRRFQEGTKKVPRRYLEGTKKVSKKVPRSYECIGPIFYNKALNCFDYSIHRIGCSLKSSSFFIFNYFLTLNVWIRYIIKDWSTLKDVFKVKDPG